MTAGFRPCLSSFLVISAIVLPPPTFAQSSPSSPSLFQYNKVPLPPGPFASWPPDSVAPAIRGVYSRCMFVIGMLFDNYQGSKGAAMQEIRALLPACVANAMPDDWPGQAEARSKSAASYEGAKHLDPKALDPARVPFPKWKGK